MSPEELSYGLVPAGTTRMRLFRVDNASNATASFQAASVASPDFVVEVVRYVPDPPNEPIRVPVTLPFDRPPGTALFFEVTFVSPGLAEPLGPLDVEVMATIGGAPAPDVLVPIVGTAEGCGQGTAVCDADPTNGCDTDVQTSLEHCGGCDNPCSLPNTTAVCEAGACKPGVCSPGFGDCNGAANDGCETDVTSSVSDCGACNFACDLPNATEACVGGACVPVACAAPFDNCDLMPGNGCETNLSTSVAHCGACGSTCDLANAAESCVSGACTLGACTMGFGNCDGLGATGCETNLGTSVTHCGACGSTCDLANAAESCVAGACTLGMCVMGFGNCDGTGATGCETDLTGDASNCGGCNNDCTTLVPNAEVACTGGACELVTCLPGFVDVDGASQNGCECQFMGSDLPDDGFADTNCDGVDGDASAAVFVAKTGNDMNQGTRTSPMLTVSAGISRAVVLGKKQVYVSQGVYDGRVTLANGVSVYGGYSAQNNWARSAAYVATIQSSAVVNGRVSAVEGKDLVASIVVDRLTIQTGDTAAAGISNYGLYCNNCGALTLRNNTITAGAAGAGAAGINGTAGAAGNIGNGGSPGSCDGPGVRTGGSGGASPCSRTGGLGGTGGAEGANAGGAGLVGVGNTPGGTGGAGGDPGKAGGNGQNGAAGTNGANGAGGSGGSTLSFFWIGNAGLVGVIGVHGNGGGGGGGGGGQGAIAVNNGGGNGAGGGGAGGCGGTGGAGGNAGGGSFGLFVLNSTGMVLTGNTIKSNKGGNGGSGGSGATGGNGGSGGLGATTCTAEVGAGGNGGTGGKGGNGGHGGGGAGGPSYAVYRVGSPLVSVAGNTLTAGTGGTGGTSSGNPGTAGSSGQVF